MLSKDHLVEAKLSQPYYVELGWVHSFRRPLHDFQIIRSRIIFVGHSWCQSSLGSVQLSCLIIARSKITGAISSGSFAIFLRLKQILYLISAKFGLQAPDRAKRSFQGGAPWSRWHLQEWTQNIARIGFKIVVTGKCQKIDTSVSGHRISRNQPAFLLWWNSTCLLGVLKGVLITNMRSKNACIHPRGTILHK